MRKTGAGLTLAALAALALIVGACKGGSGKAAAPGAQSPGATAVASAGASSSPYPAAWQTPIALPVTPVALSFHNTDPKFDALPGARAIYGDYSGGVYQIEVPDAWNGDVVYFAHGFRGQRA